MSNVTQVLSEAYDLICELGFTPQRNILLVKINELLEELEKCEPVAYIHKHYLNDDKDALDWHKREHPQFKMISLYTSPPKREWVELSKEDIREAIKLSSKTGIGVDDFYFDEFGFAKAIEVKSRELNTKG